LVKSNAANGLETSMLLKGTATSNRVAASPGKTLDRRGGLRT